MQSRLIDEEVARRTAVLEHKMTALEQEKENMEEFVLEFEAKEEQLLNVVENSKAQTQEAHSTTAFFRNLVRGCTRGRGFFGGPMGM